MIDAPCIEESNHCFCIQSTVIVRFKAVGNAPIMKQNYFKITAGQQFSAVIQFLRKELQWKSEPLVSSFTCIGSGCCSCLFRFYLVHIYQPGVCTCTRRFRLESVQSTWLRTYPTSQSYISSQSFATDGHLIVNYR